MNNLQTAVEAALRTYIEPHLGKDLLTAGVVRALKLEGKRLNLQIRLGFPAKTQIIPLTSAIKNQLAAIGLTEISVEIDWEIFPHRVQSGQAPLSGVKNVLAVASGKGGVGKSTVAANLALALVQEGAQVGLLDADIYGPSIPRMFGVREHPKTQDGKTLEPIEAFGLKLMSIGFLVEEDTPMIWRGPMATSALKQLLTQTHWQALDYLIVDLPPGTGDIHLTLVQQIPVAGAVIITTPQPIALLDAMKGLKMFEKVKVPVLGIVENMSLYRCPKCGHEEAIFGQGGGKELAQKYGVPLLGKLPLDSRIRELADVGQPIVAADPNSKLAQSYGEIARKMAAYLSLQPKDTSGKFPKIVVER